MHSAGRRAWDRLVLRASRITSRSVTAGRGPPARLAGTTQRHARMAG